jgi:SAM-dependent methyltransferase
LSSWWSPTSGAPASRREEAERDRVERLYRGYARSARKQRAWDTANPGNLAIRAELAGHVRRVASAELASAGDILDIGCGTGWWLRWLAAEGVAPERLHGVERLGDRAEAVAAAVPGASIVAGDARSLPYASERFALMLLFTVLSSLGGRADLERALREARRVTAPGGLVLVWEPRVPDPRNRGARRIRPAEVLAVLGGHGEVRSTTVFPPLARRLGQHTNRLYPAVVRFPPLRSHRLMAVRPASRGA